ncbi:hypothetical protein EYR36_002254 [Pleurotus pulmonarius]|nr:hypothetical protein EYR36_002254 [Pleurotus pulmonarius]
MTRFLGTADLFFHLITTKMPQIHVLVVGAAGRTGRPIASAILKESNQFRLSILVREASKDKPAIKELTDAGAELVVGDISDSVEKLGSYLKGVDVLISTVLVMVDQKPLFLAAKNAGVGRVIPSDFASTAPKGVMFTNDIKLAIRDYIKELGLGYTFIEVGTWLHVMFPPLHSATDTLLTHKSYPGDKRQKTIYSTMPTIGALVARIIADPRTLNQTVVAYDGEISLSETWAIAERITGEDFSDYYHNPNEELERGAQQMQNVVKRIVADYFRSLYIRGDNTLANATAMGRLDARRLYEDVPYADVEEEAKKHYTSGAVSESTSLPGAAVLDVVIHQQAYHQELTDAGAEVIRGDISESPEKLESYLKGVDVLISTVPVTVDQKPLILAAKKAGVGRVVPPDFGPIAPKGVMDMHDLKLGIREYVKELGLPHTFIEDGWWLLWMFPPLHSAKNTVISQKAYAGNRSQKLIYSTLPTIGKMVARIIVDPRTLNQTVVAYDGEISLDETWKIAEKVSGEDFSDYPKIFDEEIERGCQQMDNWVKRFGAQYQRTLFIRGDNTLAKAEALGHLDSRKLYNDVPYPDVEEVARNHYKSGFVLEYSVPEELLFDVFETVA